MLSANFGMKNLGEASVILGIKVTMRRNLFRSISLRKKDSKKNIITSNVNQYVLLMTLV